MIPGSLFIIAVPLVAAALAYMLRRWHTTEVLIAVVACGFVITVVGQPLSNTFRLGVLTIDIGAPLNLLGRVLAVRASDRSPLVLLFAIAMILFALSWRVPQGWSFVSLGLAVLSMLSAGLLIRPFVFAGLAFEAAAALIAIMIQSERSGPATTVGALRFLTLSTLALPAFLGAGYAVGQASTITDSSLQAAAYRPAVILLVIGFGLLFGAFPLFTWTHAVAHDAPPLTTAFLATISSGIITFLFLALKQESDWFLSSPDLGTAINFLAIASLALGGLLGWAQQSFSRIVACGLSVEIGATLLLLNINTPIAVEAVAFGLVARTLSLGLMGLGMTLLRQHAESDAFTLVRGLGTVHPWAAVAIALGGMSLAGLPGTVGFVTRWTTVRALGPSDPELLVFMLLCGASVGIGVVRGMMALLAPGLPSSATSRTPQSKRSAVLTVMVMTMTVVLLGIAPGAIAAVIKAVAAAYTFYR